MRLRLLGSPLSGRQQACVGAIRPSVTLHRKGLRLRPAEGDGSDAGDDEVGIRAELRHSASSRDRADRRTQRLRANELSPEHDSPCGRRCSDCEQDEERDGDPPQSRAFVCGGRGRTWRAGRAPGVVRGGRILRRVGVIACGFGISCQCVTKRVHERGRGRIPAIRIGGERPAEHGFDRCGQSTAVHARQPSCEKLVRNHAEREPIARPGRSSSSSCSGAR
jgi:hypothetical protein